MPASPLLHRVTVIGCGTVGTSLALALSRAGVEVFVEDHDPDAVARAMLLGAGSPLGADTPPADLVVVATPAETVVDVLYEAQARGLGYAYTDVAGGTAEIWAEAELRGCDVRGYVPSRPVPGLGGLGGIRADRFDGRPWLVYPFATAEPVALGALAALIALCGASRRDVAAAGPGVVPVSSPARLKDRGSAPDPAPQAPAGLEGAPGPGPRALAGLVDAPGSGPRARAGLVGGAVGTEGGPVRLKDRGSAPDPAPQAPAGLEGAPGPAPRALAGLVDAPGPGPRARAGLVGGAVGPEGGPVRLKDRGSAPDPAPQTPTGLEGAPGPAPQAPAGLEGAPGPAPRALAGLEGAPGPGPRAPAGLVGAPGPGPPVWAGLRCASAFAPAPATSRGRGRLGWG
ncbi:prephenate dehydrogenase/arogenate dehydrogenase family protein [Streptomyces bambusae]|uniref:prephenate dehydrogenase/arogenate dehydrogenase family protein n=1 Tax=Streptomyces bambusae TaxID=1550616 RepID=UPI001CFE7D6D|nr:prephenate dehydrogenase/arogenate dehydrogenase family protein [Streptomyces bambusae]